MEISKPEDDDIKKEKAEEDRIKAEQLAITEKEIQDQKDKDAKDKLAEIEKEKLKALTDIKEGIDKLEKKEFVPVIIVVIIL